MSFGNAETRHFIGRRTFEFKRRGKIRIRRRRYLHALVPALSVRTPSAFPVFRNGVCGNESESETQSSFQIGRGFHLDDQCGFLPIFTAPAGRGKTAVINLRFAEYTRSLVVRSSYAPNGIAGLRERDGFRVGVKRTSVNSIFSTVGRLRIAQEEIGNRRDGIDRFRSARVISLLRKRDFRTVAHIIEFENDASRPNRLPVVGFYRKIDRRISHAGNDIGRRPIQRQFVGILHGDMPIGVAPNIERETTAVVGDRFERSRRNFQGSDSSVAVRIVVGAGIEYDGSCGHEHRRCKIKKALFHGSAF